MNPSDRSGHPSFDADYERFWRRYRSAAAEARELSTIEQLGGLQPGMRVLDLACGFGRISNPMAARGYRVTGVDSSPGLLEIARQEAAPGAGTEYLLADMRRQLFDSRFDLVLIWSTSLGYYEEVDDESTLRSALRALVPGGWLLIESRHWDAFHRPFEDYTERTSGPDKLCERHRYDPLTGRQLTEQRLTVNGQQSSRSYHLRRYGVPELRSICLRNGFSEVSAFDEAGEPLRTDSVRAILRARRPVDSAA